MKDKDIIINITLICFEVLKFEKKRFDQGEGITISTLSLVLVFLDMIMKQNKKIFYVDENLYEWGKKIMKQETV